MTVIAYPPKPSPGDRVAVVSPASGLPGLLPLPYELGLRRLREVYGLEPVEYPATRKTGSTPAERAADLHAAFADPDIKAVFATIGGDDRITVLPLLDRELIRAARSRSSTWTSATPIRRWSCRTGARCGSTDPPGASP